MYNYSLSVIYAGLSYVKLLPAEELETYNILGLSYTTLNLD